MLKVRTASPALRLHTGKRTSGCLARPLPTEHEQRAAYVVEGALQLGAERAEAGRMLVFAKDAKVILRADEATRVVPGDEAEFIPLPA
jgi:redox-sensitive bicupin YhaK (pirin superfamily)